MISMKIKFFFNLRKKIRILDGVKLSLLNKLFTINHSLKNKVNLS